MKFYNYIIVLLVVVAASCSNVKRAPGKVYMPDMAYSRTHESYAPIDSSVYTNDTSAMRSSSKYFFNATPVHGTVRRGDTISYDVTDTDTASYNLSDNVLNPLARELSTDEYNSIDRLYNINCGICHGTKLDGNGPLWKAQKLPNQPAILVGNPKYETMSEGKMFYSITYGKNSMGGYSSQLTKLQRWQMTKYIKMKQSAGKAPADSTKKDN
jgi:mono/diheme cytochrome c family protein